MGELPVPTPPPEEIHARASEILSRPEFQPDDPNPLEQFLDWISRWIGDLLQSGMEQSSGNRLLGLAILIVATALIGFMIWRFVRRMRANPEPEEDALVVEVSRSARDWRREAERLELEQQWKEALRARYRVLVGELVDRDLVPDVPGRTTGEYRVDVSASAPRVTGQFGDASELFELAWYADRSTGQEENRRIRALTDEVLEAVGR